MWSAKAITKKNIPLDKGCIKKGEEITITKGQTYKYALWHHLGIYDLPKEYVGNIIEITGN